MKECVLSGHQAGAQLVPTLPPLLSGEIALLTLLLHGNQLGLAGLQQLAEVMSSGSVETETLVISQAPLLYCVMITTDASRI